MKHERRYYLAQGQDEEIVRQFFKERDDAFSKTKEIAAKFGGHPVTQGWRMAGIVFDGGAPSGWKRKDSLSDGRPYFMPERRSKAGKEAHAEIRSVSIPGASELHSKFSNNGGEFGDAGPNGGFYILYITAEIIGGQCIIHVPEKMDFHPPHSKPLKHSEYWQIQEAKVQ